MHRLLVVCLLLTLFIDVMFSSASQSYDRTTGTVLDYRQLFGSIDEINLVQHVELREEYTASQAYGIAGPIDATYWCAFFLHAYVDSCLFPSHSHTSGD